MIETLLNGLFQGYDESGGDPYDNELRLKVIIDTLVVVSQV